MTPREQAVKMFGSPERAAAEEPIYKSPAWSPKPGQEAASLVAWQACQRDPTGRFVVGNLYDTHLEAGDCMGWWTGTDQKLQLFSGW
jgi:hypothetical protein